MIERKVVRDDDDDRRGHQSLNVPKDFDAAAIPKRRVQDRDIRFAIQNHRGGFFGARGFSHHVHVGDFLKTPLQFFSKVDICVG